MSELDAALAHVRAGDVQFDRGNALVRVDALGQPHVFVPGVAEEVDDHLGRQILQTRQHVAQEAVDADVLQSDRVQHPTAGLGDPDRRIARQGLERQALGHQAAEAMQVGALREFQTVAERAARGEDRVLQPKRADPGRQIGRGRPHRVAAHHATSSRRKTGPWRQQSA